MKRWEVVLAIAGALLTGLSAWTIHRTELPRQDFVITNAGCRMPVTLLALERPRPVGAAVIFHGLSANRRTMQTLGTYLAANAHVRVYLIDLPGHGDNVERFTFARAEHCADTAVESLIRGGQIDPKETILVGHSMGGAIAIRIADSEPVAATVAISPAPMTLPQRMPANLLVFSAQYDLGVLKHQTRVLADAAGGERTNIDDFLQRRAFHLETVPHATHTSLIFDPSVAGRSSHWAVATLNPAAHPLRVDVFQSAVVILRQMAPWVSLVGFAFLFPAGMAAATKWVGYERAESVEGRPARMLALVEGLTCALVAALILMRATPLKFLHLYAGDYLASLLLIAGVLLLGLNWKAAKASVSPNARPLLAAVVLGLGTMLAIGGWLNWQLTDMWLNAPRWLRFAALLPVAWIFCLAEEVTLGPVEEGRRRALRFAVFLGLRLELWLACVAAYYLLASGQVLIVILVAFLAAFSMLQRLATDALRRRTGSATAAALFGAILAAWFIAAVFPLN